MERIGDCLATLASGGVTDELGGGVVCTIVGGLPLFADGTVPGLDLPDVGDCFVATVFAAACFTAS